MAVNHFLMPSIPTNTQKELENQLKNLSEQVKQLKSSDETAKLKSEVENTQTELKNLSEQIKQLKSSDETAKLKTEVKNTQTELKKLSEQVKQLKSTVETSFSQPKPTTTTTNTPSKPETALKLDYRQILSKYDTEAIKNSPMQYHKAIISLVDEIIGILEDQEAVQAEKIAEISRIGLNLQAKYVESPHLTPEENTLLETRQEFLSEKLKLGTDEAKRRILMVKEQAETFFRRLEEINMGY